MNRLLAAFLLAIALASPALADDVPGDRATSFQAVSGADGEGVPGGNLMVGAYALIWLFVGLYVVRMGRAQRAIEGEIASLEKRVAKLAKPEA